MLKALYAGLVTLLIVVIIAFLMDDWHIMYLITLGISLLSLLATGISIGSFNTSFGTRPLPRGQFEQNTDGNVKWSTRFLIFGFPHIIVTATYVYFVILN